MENLSSQILKNISKSIGTNRKIKMNTHPIDDIQNLIRRLRGKNGCPWDKKQTPQSMGRYLIEEVYELIDAIDSKDSDHVCEELGDVLFLVLFILIMHEEENLFSLNDVASRAIEKMTRRHPHVFGTDTVQSADDVKQKWQELKKNEKNKTSISPHLPGLLKAYLLSERMNPTPNISENQPQFLKNAESTLLELKKILLENRMDQFETAIGSILYSLVNLARSVQVHPEMAFIRYLKHIENQLA